MGTRTTLRRERVGMTTRGALAFIRKHGIVFEAAQGAVPSLATAIAHEPIHGRWWSHPKAHAIYRITQAVRDSEEVLVCRLVDAKVTFIHRRLWPALVRVASQLPAEGLAQVKEVHTESGRHIATTTPFPQWVPSEVFAAAQKSTEEEAIRQLEECAGWVLRLRHRKVRGRSRED
jgi:hypothetical protein